MLVVPIGIPNVVLHVTDDHILPIRDIERAILTELNVGRTEVFVLANQQVLDRLAPDIAGLGIPIELVLLKPEKADRVADQEIALQPIREVGA